MSNIRKTTLTIYTTDTPRIGYLDRIFQFGDSKFISSGKNYSKLKLPKDFDDAKAELKKESKTMLLFGETGLRKLEELICC